MEKLDKTRQADLRKMSDARLHSKLTQAGFTLEQVETMDRTIMLDTYAELVLTGKEPPKAVFGYDVELEKRRLEFQIQQWEADRADRENDRIEREAERSHRSSRAVMLKRFGDALRATTTKIGTDPVDVITFFDNIEKEFRLLEVPDEIRVCLIKPFLNDRAKTLITQLASSHSNDYFYVKNHLLNEFKLVPSQLLDDYNHLVKPPQQSFKAYMARLRLLLSYYLSGKCVDSFEAMKDLFLCDRLKSILPEPMLTHVLRAESALDKGRSMTSDVLVELLDEFAVTFNKFGQAKTTPYTQFQRKPNVQSNGGQCKDNEGSPRAPIRNSSSVVTGNRNTGDRACYRCGSQTHLANKCSLPREPGTAGDKQWQPRLGHSTHRPSVSSSARPAKINRCVVDETNAPRPTENHGQSGARNDIVHLTDTPMILHDADDDTTSVVPPVNFSVSSVNACLQAEQNLTQPIGALEQTNEAMNKLQLAKLEYVDLRLPTGIVTGLVDSGSELNVLHKDALQGMDIDPVGEVEFRGIIGEPVKAPIVRLPIRLNDDTLSDEDNVMVMFAICTNLNESCIISAPTMYSLNDIFNAKLCLNTNGSRDNDMSIVSAVTTRSQACSNVVNAQNENYSNECSDDIHAPVDDDSDEAFIDVDNISANIRSDLGVDNAIDFAKEQHEDQTLFPAWQLARVNKSNYFIRDNLLFHKIKRCEQTLELLVVPHLRRKAVVRLSHADNHFSPRRTKERIITSGLFWEGILKDCVHHCVHCEVCQLRSRKTVWDRVPIKACIPENEAFRTMMMDCIGPIKPGANLKFNYALIVVDVATRYPFCYPLKSLSAKNVCDALLKMFEFTSLPITIASDNGSNFRSSLTREMLRRFGVSSRFATAYHPVSIVERQIGTLKGIIGKLVLEREQDWTTYLGPALFAMRTTINENLGCSPHLLLFGHWPCGPLKYLSDTWSGQNCLPTHLSKSAVEYLENLQEKLKTTQHYAAKHLRQEQNRHIQHYNLRARHKSFVEGDRCLILRPASTSSHTLRRWKGPATVVEKLSEYSYLVEYNNARYRLHANLLRKFHTQVNQITCLSLDFSTIGNNLDFISNDKCNANVHSIACNCAVIFESDTDFGEISVINPPNHRLLVNLPSQKLASGKLDHLAPPQRQQVLDLLDKYPEVFSDVPGLCTVTQHEIPILDSFKPKSLRPYRVPQQYQSEVSRQIKELLELGFIEKSTSPQASPIIVCLKAKDSKGNRGVRIAIDYRYVNKYTIPSVAPIEDIARIIQDVGKSPFISTFDCKSGYHQCLVKPADRWLTSFICEEGQFQWVRTPFGMRSSGTTFVRAMKTVLHDIKEFAKSYVDDIAVHSDSFVSHLHHIERFLKIVKLSGITLSIDKVELVKPKTKFLGSIIGSGERSVNPDKVTAIEHLKEPESKKQLRQIIGLFSFFREFIPGFAMICKPLTDLTSKRIPDRIPFGSRERIAFNTLKQLLCNAANHPLSIIDSSKEFSLFVDASSTAVGAALTQSGCEGKGTLRPVAFASRKLTETQQNWSTLEREAYAALFGLQKYKYWLYGKKTILYSDHNPLLFLTESVPKSSKLMRWALALSEFDIEFRYRVGRQNEAADCLSRMVSDDGGDGTKSIDGPVTLD